MSWQRFQELLADPATGSLLGLAILIGACVIAWLVGRYLIVVGVEKLVLRTRTGWDDVLHDCRVLHRLTPVLPALVAQYGIELVPHVEEEFERLVARVALAVVLLVCARALMAVLTAANILYTRDPTHAGRPIKGYVQVAQMVIAIVTGVLILAQLLDESPVVFLSGLGAMTAVLLLIFRDTILSLVASVQITGNDMVRRGDWIEMPNYGADGDVIDVALHTVKVRNWDNTVTTIPTHKLIEDSFKNWRFMSTSGGRRIKRTLWVDTSSVRFLEEGEIERFEHYALLRDYIAAKRRELAKYNAGEGRNPEIGADIRRLTNLGTFRAYLEHYLRSHPRIHQRMTLLVRHLQSGPTGIPIEIYCFTNTTDWGAYEGIQADLFDHFVAIAPEFGLRIFQSPSGRDLERLARESS